VLARLVDVVLRVSLLVRGRVPRGLVAAAERITSAHLAVTALVLLVLNLQELLAPPGRRGHRVRPGADEPS
jgi:hypothetical protein